MKIKCTYSECYQHFETQAAMIKHKKKDAEHAYCSKCDLDCDDDMDYMIHQIESSKHIVCPVCGMEFKSAGGRDRHVETNHAAAQRIPCRGCKMVFTRASALMSHIEKDECKVISLKDFQRERAERAIEKDAFADQLSARDGSVIVGSAITTSQGSSELDQVGGVSLLDSQCPTAERDWRQNIIRPSTQGSYRAPLPQPSGHSITALTKFPALPATSTNQSTVSTPKANTDLLDINDIGDKVSNLSVTSGAWSTNANSRTLFPVQHTLQQLGDEADNLSEIPFNADGASVLSSYQPHVQSQRTLFTGDNIPPSAPPPINDPNAPNIHITTTLKLSKSTSIPLGDYYDSIRETYVCPGSSCGRMYPTPSAFYDHLLSGAHVGGHVTCPSCLNRFRTNSALISHMEAGGKGCNIRNSTNYNQVLREVTAGLLGTSGHLEDGSVRYSAPGDEGWDFAAEDTVVR